MSIQVTIVGSNDEARLALVKALGSAPAEWDLRLHDSVPAAGIVVCDRGVDAPGAIFHDGSATELIATIKERATGRPQMIAVTGAGGGTGATSVALHLAAELSARGRSTAMADLGSGWGPRVRLGLDPSDSPGEPVPVAGGFRLVTDLDQVSGFERAVVEVPLTHLDGVARDATFVLVFPPSPEGARRARAIVEDHPNRTWRFVTNRLGPGGETTRAQIERLVGHPVVALPCCAALRDSEDTGRLLTRGWTRWSRAIARLAAELDAD